MAERVVAVARFGFLAWAVTVFARGHIGDGVSMLVMFGLLFVPRALDMGVVFEAAFVVVWSLQALGQVEGFWHRYPWWDTLVHALLPAVLAPTGLVLLVRLEVLPDVLHPHGVREMLGTILLAAMIAAAFGVLYEIYEWTMDSVSGTHYQPDNQDTMTDLTATTLGGLAGAIAFTTVRRWSPHERGYVPTPDRSAA